MTLLQSQDFLGQPLDTRREFSGSWEQESWLDGCWGPGEPDRRGDRSADAVYDPGGGGTVDGGREEQHHHSS